MCSIPYEEFYIWLYFVLTGRDYGNNRCNSPYSIETVFIMKGMEAFCLNPLDAKPFSLISAKGFLVKFVYREVMTLSV